MTLFEDSEATTLMLLVFLATGTLAFALMFGARARSAVRRRAATVGSDEATDPRHSLRYSGLAAARKLVDYTTKHYAYRGQRGRQGVAPSTVAGRDI